ncbi:hypothetical protein EHI8A_009320 [Entamoeba histolytica HM-1:IMSS-B]|uniref:Uncharacterized protein n=6 Tax=Entamoeba histolytica TaxID=5759 RepID=C4LV78_ENTH1|nr:hypothetical protein EHI_183020 [Entamoeba histolytica HM-1:IMSS]EMD43864.1 Hypothetical protein EHI5A_025120 [Entamoeba histolytica KU27]EMH76749.1 hypothetical protein EHI8A_009320 [Entamoeba histolytica HM-1:IMSS-B]EMS10949.1 hypothetical protein KM1_016420 [Entamoeba histolytica HM-3:IMSS]ENY60143.1 hypothetical protein EHI7A_012610 [Entamoeba histolytica HM-1:IMSS-A]GAT92564.1 hypothetical protein CL6EHI_183020 [Entamoeba histolytica]|eukprot:XP_654971.1 hypothetical protein EHI_183020 [Entamoeba histolytica HM-1:IMSS]
MTQNNKKIDINQYGIVFCDEEGVRIEYFDENYICIIKQIYVKIPYIKSVCLINETTIGYCCFASKETSPCTVYIHKFDIKERTANNNHAIIYKDDINSHLKRLNFKQEIKWIQVYQDELYVLLETDLIILSVNDFSIKWNKSIEDPSFVEIGFPNGQFIASTLHGNTINFISTGSISNFPFSICQNTIKFIRIMKDNTAFIGLGEIGIIHSFVMKTNNQITLKFDTNYDDCIFIEKTSKYYIVCVSNNVSTKIMAFEDTKSRTIKAIDSFELDKSYLPCCSVVNEKEKFIAIITKKSVIYFTNEFKFKTEKKIKLVKI